MLIAVIVCPGHLILPQLDDLKDLFRAPAAQHVLHERFYFLPVSHDITSWFSIFAMYFNSLIAITVMMEIMADLLSGSSRRVPDTSGNVNQAVKMIIESSALKLSNSISLNTLI